MIDLQEKSSDTVLVRSETGPIPEPLPSTPRDSHPNDAELKYLGVEISDPVVTEEKRLLMGLIIFSLFAICFIDLWFADEFNVTSLYVVVIFLTLSTQRIGWVIGITFATILLNLFGVRWHNMYPPEGWSHRAALSHLLVIAGAQVPAGILAYRTMYTQRRLESNRAETIIQQRRLLDMERHARKVAEELQTKEATARTIAEDASKREAEAAREARVRAKELERTIDRLRQTRQERDVLRNLTESFQRTLLPDVPAMTANDQLALGPFYQPAIQEMQMGGDFYDAIPLPNGWVGLLIGDVAGHGVEAAAQTAFVSTTFRAFAAEEPCCPVNVMARANRALTRDRQINSFVSVFYGAYDPEARRIIYANAGHEPPILIRANGRIEALDSTGMVGGVDASAVYIQSETSFDPGDCLILLTDGMTEARREGSANLLGWDGVANLALTYRNKTLTEKRLAGSEDAVSDLIDANEFAYSLYQDALNFAGQPASTSPGQRQDTPGLSDDVALLVVLARHGQTTASDNVALPTLELTLA